MIEEESHHEDDHTKLEQDIMETSLNPFLMDRNEEFVDDTRKLNQSDLANQTQD